MPFGTLTLQTVNYEPRKPGLYSKVGVTFADPQDNLQVRGAVPSKSGLLTAQVVRLKQKDVIDPVTGKTRRTNATVTTIIQTAADSGFTPAELDSMASDNAEFITAITVSRMMQSES